MHDKKLVCLKFNDLFQTFEMLHLNVFFVTRLFFDKLETNGTVLLSGDLNLIFLKLFF